MRYKNLLLFLLVSFYVFGQSKQPKVGLVLSGGGAKGFAHIGALKEIERAGVHIDYIAGTSIGAIIGAFYASGYTANQIEEIIKKTDFNALLQDKIERKNYPLFVKTHQEKHALSLPISKEGISLPKAVSKGQNIRNYFTQILGPLASVNNFKELPIPFLCIATDIENGEKVVYENGSLNLAIQASGAFPTLLYPVEIDGRLLIDGGVSNNFPVEELKKKGMDIIIGLDVQDQLSDRKQLKNALDYLSQIVSFGIHKKSQSQLKDVDIHIHPKLPGYSVISFKDGDTIIKTGEIEAKKYRKKLDSVARLQQHKKKIAKMKFDNPKFTINKVAIEGLKNFTSSYVIGAMDLQAGDSVSYKSISNNISKLYATDNFINIDYQLNNTTSEKTLTLKVKEAPTKSYIKLGAHYDQLFGVGILTNYTHKNLITDNDIFSFDLVLGDKIRYELNYFVDNGFHLGFGLQSSYKKFNANVRFASTNGDIKLDTDFSELLNRVYLQTKFDRKYAFSFGGDYRIYKGKSETIIIEGKELVYEDTDYGVLFANLKIDSFNKAMYPTEGLYFSSTLDWIAYSDKNAINANFINSSAFKPFTQLHAKFSSATTFFKQLTLQHAFETGFSIGNPPTDAFAYKIGSYNKNLFGNFINFYGLELAEYKRNNFLKADAELRYNFYRKNHLIANANFIKMENESLLNNSLLENVTTGYAIGYGLETILGPIEIKYSWSDDSLEKGKVIFNLGFWF